MSTCIQCGLNKALQTGVCGDPTTPLVDCSYYGSETVCRRCIDTKMPVDANGASCLSGSVTKCKVYSLTDVC